MLTSVSPLGALTVSPQGALWKVSENPGQMACKPTSLSSSSQELCVPKRQKLVPVTEATPATTVSPQCLHLPAVTALQSGPEGPERPLPFGLCCDLSSPGDDAFCLERRLVGNTHV